LGKKLAQLAQFKAAILGKSCLGEHIVHCTNVDGNEYAAKPAVPSLDRSLPHWIKKVTTLSSGTRTFIKHIQTPTKQARHHDFNRYKVVEEGHNVA
jgi:hypothetical protein